MLLYLHLDMSTQFVKNTNSPPQDSELWSVADGWKTSTQTGLDYTNLDQVYESEEEHDFIDALKDQLSGKVKQSIDYAGHFMVASYSQNGKPLVYAYPKNRAQDADKKASYNKGVVPTGTGGPQQQQSRPQQQQVFKPQQSNTTASSTVQTTAKPSFTKQTLEVPFDMRMVAWNDKDAVEDAILHGLYPLPVKHVGVENFGFIGEVTGQRTFWYGRVKLVEID